MESRKTIFTSFQNLKPQQIVWYLPMGSDKQKIAEITLKGQKSTGKYQNWLNIKNTRGNSKSSILEGDEDLDNL